MQHSPHLHQKSSLCQLHHLIHRWVAHLRINQCKISSFAQRLHDVNGPSRKKTKWICWHCVWIKMAECRIDTIICVWHFDFGAAENRIWCDSQTDNHKCFSNKKKFGWPLVFIFHFKRMLVSAEWTMDSASYVRFAAVYCSVCVMFTA